MPKPHLLVVDDDKRLARTLSRTLNDAGFATTLAYSGYEARELLDKHSFELVILDLLLPDDHGFDLGVYVRGNSRCGLIFLTGTTDVFDKVTALELGGDDYVNKPFSERELIARVRSVLRRVTSEPASSSAHDPVRFGNWIYDMGAYELHSSDGEMVYLTSSEHHLLQQLLQHPNRVVGRESLYTAINGRAWNPDDRSIDILVSKLRRKLTTDSEDIKYIQTIRGAGYKLVVPVSSVPASATG